LLENLAVRDGGGVHIAQVLLCFSRLQKRAEESFVGAYLEQFNFIV
jgi:hypothetical protein